MSLRPAQTSLAVIGGGLIGLSAAWRLSQSGFSVTVFEKGTAGSEASWAGAGMLAPGGELESPSPLATLALESRQSYRSFVRELEERTGMSIDYQECGAIDLAYSAAQWADLQQRAERQSAFGISTRVLNEDQVKTFWPRVRRDELQGGVFYPGDGIVNPRELVAALLAACHRSGVRIVENCAVSAAELTRETIALQAGPKAERFDAAILAAGAWSSSISVAGVPALPSSHPVKGHLIGYSQPEQTCNTIVRYGHTYLLQRANGLLIVGASVEHVGWDRAIRPEIAAELAAQAGFVLPHLTETSPSEVWIGFRPGSEDLRIGRWHSDRLYLAYGHYRNGILLAPVTAQRIANEITANLGKPPFDSAADR